MGAGARAHLWGGVSPFEMYNSIGFKHQSIAGRPPLEEILYPPLTTRCWCLRTMRRSAYPLRRLTYLTHPSSPLHSRVYPEPGTAVSSASCTRTGACTSPRDPTGPSTTSPGANHHPSPARRPRRVVASVASALLPPPLRSSTASRGL